MKIDNTEKVKLDQEDLEKKSEKIEIEYHPHGIYYVMPAQIMDCKYLNNTEKLCYILLSGLADEKGECFPSDEYIGQRINLSEDRIGRVIASLEKHGLIEKTTKRFYGKRPKRTIRILFSFQKKRSKSIDNQDVIVKDDQSGNNDNVVVENNDNVVVENDGTIYKGIESEEVLESEEREGDRCECCNHLFEKLKKLRPNRSKPNWKKWELDMKRMKDIDKRKTEDILRTIDWVFDTDNKFVVDCPASLRKKYENIADHIYIANKRQVEAEKTKSDSKLVKAFEILKKYLSEINDCRIASDLSLRLDEKIIYHTTQRYPAKRTYKRFIEILKDNKAPAHLIGKIETGTRNAGNEGA